MERVKGTHLEGGWKGLKVLTWRVDEQQVSSLTIIVVLYLYHMSDAI